MDTEALLNSSQKAEIVKAAILRHAEGELAGPEFRVVYDRRYGSIFAASRIRNEGEPLVKVTFSISPVKLSMDTFFQNAAREAAQAVIDILERRVTAATKPKPSQEVTCPCCQAKVRIVT